jgi:hypothetical protein
VTQTISFAAGETLKTIEVAAAADGRAESAEDLVGFLRTTQQGDSLSGVGSAAANVFSQEYSLKKLSDATEGGSASFRVSRTGDTSVGSSVRFVTTNGSATAGLDFTQVDQAVSFAAGETSKDISVLTLRDSLAEGTESFNASLRSLHSDSIISGGSATASIGNGAAPSSYALTKLSDAIEGGKATFQVRRSGDLSVAGAVNFATRNGSALAGQDYTAVAETINFAAGESSKSTYVQTNLDSLTEGAESFSASLSIAFQGDAVTNSAATAGIIDVILSTSNPL